MYKKLNILIFAAVLLGLFTLGFYKRTNDKSRLNKISANDQYKAIDINQIFMWISNNGDGSNDPRTGNSGFFWPGGVNATQAAVFEDGLIWGGKVGREIRVNGSTYRHGLQAGKILDNGLPDDPSLSKYRIYKIRKDWQSFPAGPERDALESDFNDWPVEDGAPWVDVDGDGYYTKGVDQPKFVGDEVLWFVSNDMDAGRSTFMYGTLPMGIENQVTVFGFNRTGDLGDMVFKKYLILNKGTTTIRDMVVGYWSDTDLGDASDDFTGADTVLSLGYTYNGKEVDGVYGSPCPADGYDFFQGPIVPSDDPVAIKLGLPDSAKFLGKWRKGISNLPMTAFTFYINGDNNYADPDLGTAEGSIQFYNYITGKVGNTGEPFIDPNTGEQTSFVLSGDPVAGTGWYEGAGWPGGPSPGDRRHVIASGPFTMVPGDSQEVVVGILIGRSTTTTLASVTELKRKDLAAQIAYDLDFNLTPAPPVPVLHANPLDGAITLWWETNAESYDAIDPLIVGQGKTDTTYTFQGYQLWQFSNQAGADATLLATWDVVDSIESVYGNEVINGENIRVPKIVGPNEGIKRFSVITKDEINGLSLRDGTPYYFAVTAYGVSLASSPTFLESTPSILEVIPGKKKIDYTSEYNFGDNIKAEQTKGAGDARVLFNMVDPTVVTGDKYSVRMNGSDDSLSFSLFDKITGDTLIDKSTNFVNLIDNPNSTLIVPLPPVVSESDTAGQKVIDGFQLLVSNIYQDSLFVNSANKFFVKNVLEIKGPGGTNLDTPVDVFQKLNSTKKWSITAKGASNSLIWQAKSNQSFGFVNYEIRFDGDHPFYASGRGGGFTPIKSNKDSVALGTVPFSIWDVGATPSDTDDVQLAIKVVDFSKNNTTKLNDSTIAIPDYKYSQLANGDWEQVYAMRGVANPDSLSNPSPRSSKEDFPFGALVFSGDLPEAGTVIRLNSIKKLTDGDTYEATLSAASFNNTTVAKTKIGDISVFPNPYFGANKLERNKIARFMRFTGLPTQATIRIFTLSGVFVQKIVKDGKSQYVDWNLLNSDNLPVGSGIFIAYIDMPGVGTKVMKLALIQEQQFIDRL